MAEVEAMEGEVEWMERDRLRRGRETEGECPLLGERGREGVGGEEEEEGRGGREAEEGREGGGSGEGEEKIPVHHYLPSW